MNRATAPKRGDWMNALRRIVVGWFLMLSLFGWLPVLRAFFDGPTYAWGAGYFGWSIGGSGVTASLWFPALKFVTGAVIVWAVLRNWRPAGAAAATIVTAILLTSDLHALASHEAIWFHGDTLGIRLNVSLLAPIVTAAALIACVALWVFSVRVGSSAPVPLDPVNWRRLMMIAALLPVQFVLLRFGTPHGAADAAGVIVTIVQWMMLGWALALCQAPDRMCAESRLLAQTDQQADDCIGTRMKYRQCHRVHPGSARQANHDCRLVGTKQP